MIGARNLVGVASVTASYPQILALAAAVVGIGGGVVWLYARTASLYHRTLGSRRDLAKRLNQVAVGVTTRYLEERFGAPAFVRASDIPPERPDGTVFVAGLTEQVYRTRHAWLQVLIDGQKAVTRFSITVTDPHFRFQIRDLTVYNLDVKLGHTRFSSVQQDPDGRSFWRGARRHGYSESFYFGNPGHYQRFVLSKSDAGVGGFGSSALPPDLAGSYRDGLLAIADRADPGPPPGTPVLNPAAPYATGFRSGTTISTLTVLGADYGPAMLAEPRGPDADYVRVLISGHRELRQTRRHVRQLRRLVKRENSRTPPLPSDHTASSADETVPPAV